MKLEDIVLLDGRKLLDVWPNADNKVKEGEVVGFAAIPDDRVGKVFIQHGRLISLYAFEPSGDSHFVESEVAWPESVVRRK